MRRVLLLASALALVTACGSHSAGGPGPTPDGGSSCKALAAGCTLPSDCCSAACNGACVDASQCKPAGGSCGADSECCTNSCASGVCVEPAGSCVTANEPCSTTSECCSGLCVDAGGGRTCQLSCKAGGADCASDGECCSTTCAGGKCTSSTFCKAPSEQCSEGAECCSLKCVNGTCGDGSCASVTESCIADSQCCTGICGGDRKCAALPVDTNTASCTTLGNSCLQNGDCCSQNCQGGTCVQAAYCNTTGDICYNGYDCCSGVCSHTDGTPGRCELMTGGGAGGCAQGGTPCDSASNCCSRLCVDVGTGVKVCQPSGGCRMTGDYCNSTGALASDCCNLNDSVPTSQQIVCTNNRCPNGGACNPPGNICGASTDVNASQNCCNGKKDVCKADSNGILRCFGGPPRYCGSNGCDNNSPCPNGWDSSVPECCIQPGDVCQFRDQCCNGEACVPDATGVLRCGGGAPSCKPLGSTCAGPSDHSCCESAGLTCQSYDERNQFFACLPAPGTWSASCKLDTGACTSAAQCCSGAYTDPDGSACSGSSCTCGTKATTSFCQQSGGSCTVSSDCCDGLGCDVAAGATSGTCQAAVACADTGQSCSSDVRCCAVTDSCIDFGAGATCTAPACGSQSHACTVNGDCCSGLVCEGTDSSGNIVSCATAGGTGCACQAQCSGVNAGDPCSATSPCCGAGLYCSSTTNGTCQIIRPG